MKRQMNLSNRLKKSKGITLIALIITIIVLLILAGVTINAITGNESAMEKAQQARSENEQADELDSIKLAVVDAVAKGSDGKVSAKNLKSALDGLVEEESLGETNPWTVTGKQTGKAYKITENGEVTKILTEEEKKARQTAINAKIGADVEGYTTDSDGETGGWWVYYASTDEVFLISKNVVKSEVAFGGSGGIPTQKVGTNNKYLNWNEISSYGRTYNSKLDTKLDGKDISERYPKLQSTVFLCDPDNWEKYVAKDAPEETYAVGGPTKELLVMSWNEAQKSGLNNAPQTIVEWNDEEDLLSDGYLSGGPKALSNSISPYPINKDILNGLYNDGKMRYWLASPGESNQYVCLVYLDGYVSSDAWVASYVGCRPLVSIPISNVQIEGNTVKIVK